MDKVLSGMLADYYEARRDYELGVYGDESPKIPVELFDGLEKATGREAKNAYWGLVDDLAEQVRRDYNNDRLPADSIAKAVLDDIRDDRKQFELRGAKASRLLTDKAARITDFHPESGSEDAERIYSLKREMDVALAFANGGSDGVLHLSHRVCPVDMAAYDVMASMSYEPFLWDGGAPGDDKTPATVMPSSVFQTHFERGKYMDVPWEDSAYDACAESMRTMRGGDYFYKHHIYDIAQGDVPTWHDRMAGSAELFRAVSSISDVREALKPGTHEAECLSGIFADYDAAVVCCNDMSQGVKDAKYYAADYNEVPALLDDIIKSTDYVQSPVDEAGYQLLYDLGHDAISDEKLEFFAEITYDLSAQDVQQMRMDRVAMDYYSGHDERNGKLVTRAMSMQHTMGSPEWDIDLASDYIEGEFDKLLDPAGTGVISKANRERIFDEVSAAEIILSTQGDVARYKALGDNERIKVVGDECYERLRFYGYENPVLADNKMSEMPVPKANAFAGVSYGVPAFGNRSIVVPDSFLNDDSKDNEDGKGFGF